MSYIKTLKISAATHKALKLLCTAHDLRIDETADQAIRDYLKKYAEGVPQVEPGFPFDKGLDIPSLSDRKPR